MLNQFIVVGRLTKDIDPKILEDGRKVSDLVLACQRPFKNVDGQYDTDFIKVSVWEGLATAVEPYCLKGATIGVKGRVQTYKMELDEEKKINMLEVIAEKISFISHPPKKMDDAKAELKN